MDNLDDQKEEAKTEGLNDLKKRKEEILNKIKQKKSWLMYIAMLAIAWFGYHIRTKNIPLLQGKWLPDVDSYAFLRYAEYVAAHGKMMAFDTLRYYPFGFDPSNEFGLLSYIIAYLYKILHMFNPSATVVDAAILYPPFAFFAGSIFFFLFVKKLFDYRTAIVATAFLAVSPAFLYRTMAGVSDKEPLAIALIFAALYFFVASVKAKSTSAYISNAVASGIATGLTGAVWGGVQFLFLTMGIYAILCATFGIFNDRQFYAFTAWLFSTLPALYIAYPSRYGLNSLMTSITTQVMLLGFLVALCHYLLNKPFANKLAEVAEKKMPRGILALLIAFVIGWIAISIYSGYDAIFSIISHLYQQLANPFGETRWSLTVAENHQPFFTDIIGQFSWKYIIMFIAGSSLLLYESVRRLKAKTAIGFTALYTLFVIAFSMSRYSEGSTMFNGQSGISLFVFIGSFIGFIGITIYGYMKTYSRDKHAFNEIRKFEPLSILILVWFVVAFLAARSAIRLLFAFAPVTAVLAGYFAIASFDKARTLKKDAYKIIAYILLVVIVGATFFGFSKAVLVQASYVGPSFNIQWQNAMSWAKENTPEDAVFAHWWDYGYWVQWGANRATISDGGNAQGGVNFFVGRHVLTAQSEQEALEFLKSRNVSYLLMIKEEIGKYPAFSSIGSDENYDRYSWINIFTLRQDQTRETRNETQFLFVGGTPLDDDIVYQGKLFPAGSAGIGAFILPLQNIQINDGNETRQMQKVGQPKAIIVYNGMQAQVPLKCIYVNGQEITFEGESLEGCLRVMPSIEGDGKMNPLGAALYLSPEVYKGLFAKLFLLNHESQYFKLAYSDEDKGMPLALYQGHLIGPLKIWKVEYPDNLTIPPEYYKNELPDKKFEKVRR